MHKNMIITKGGGEGFVLYTNVQKVLNVRVRRCVCVCVCVCVWGNVLASGERGFQE